jgi:hypothetical protein
LTGKSRFPKILEEDYLGFSNHPLTHWHIWPLLQQNDRDRWNGEREIFQLAARISSFALPIKTIISTI